MDCNRDIFESFYQLILKRKQKLNIPLLFNHAANFLHLPQGSFRLSIIVMDNSGNSDSLIEKIYIYEETSVNSEISASATSYSGLGSSGELTAQFQVICTPNHYGSDCSTFCQNGTGDNFTCDENGSRVCLAGWTDTDSYCQTCKNCRK